MYVSVIIYLHMFQLLFFSYGPLRYESYFKIFFPIEFARPYSATKMGTHMDVLLVN